MPSKPAARPRAWPLCGLPRADEVKPFCGRGCRARDLLNWFGEGYRVPVDQPADGTADEDNFTDE
ncbi:MAG: DNA gyrase inhibitor YacG [Sphingopyxis sp.]